MSLCCYVDHTTVRFFSFVQRVLALLQAAETCSEYDRHRAELILLLSCLQRRDEDPAPYLPALCNIFHKGLKLAQTTARLPRILALLMRYNIPGLRVHMQQGYGDSGKYSLQQQQCVCVTDSGKLTCCCCCCCFAAARRISVSGHVTSICNTCCQRGIISVEP